MLEVWKVNRENLLQSFKWTYIMNSKERFFLNVWFATFLYSDTRT